MSEIEIARLQRIVDDLEYRLRFLEDGMGCVPIQFRELGLTHSEASVLALLAKRQYCTREGIFTMLYGNRENVPDQKIVDIWICKVRKKLGLEIECVRAGYGTGDARSGGYKLTAADQQKIQLLSQATRAA